MSGIRRLVSTLAFSTLLVALAGPLTAGAQEAAAAPPTTAADAAAIEVEVDGKRWTLPIDGIRKAHLAPDV